MLGTDRIVNILARLAHEANRAYCASIGDASQVSWEDAPQWQQDSAIQGVLHLLAHPETTPEGMHDSWAAVKREAGWVYGPVKDAVAKTHPCLRPYAELPQEQRSKDFIFRAVVLTGLGSFIS